MIKVASILACLSIFFYTVDVRAQSNTAEQSLDSITVLLGDTTKQQVGDSVSVRRNNRNRVKNPQDTLLVNGVKSLVDITSDNFFAPSYIFKPSPRKAVIYSAIVPGLGQIYNRKYWKLPILYGGFIGLTYAITWNNGYYQDYLEAYKDIKDGNPNTNSWHNLLPYGQEPESIDEQWFTDVLQKRKDRYRYYRDLSIISTVGVYLIAIVDAYVDAQLFDFDMSPDLSMRMTPVIIREERAFNVGSSSYGVQWSFNF